MAASIPEVLEGKAYPTWSQYLEIMRSFKEAYPDILTIDTIGYSINNKLILAARIQTGNMPIINRPLVFLSAAIHGDEPPGYVMLIMLINELLEDYFGYGNFTDLLDQIVLIINPLANPDGTYFADDNTVYGSKRTNLNNIDLNRNFPDIYAGSFPYGYPRQKENQVMIDYMDRFPPSLSANIHTGAEVVNYPWDWRENPDPADRSPNLHPDDKWFRFISSEYADSARAGNPGYMSSFPGGITNGAAWYVIYGGRQDYVTAFLGGRELTLEISDEKIPPASEIELYYNRNNRSLINFIRQATYGVHGFVTDALTGEPLEAKINIRGHDSQYSCIYSDSTSGAFHRYLKAGKYKAVFEKRSYSVKSLEINISDYSRIDLEVKLSPLSEINCWPNPFSGEFRASFNSGTAGQCKAELFNLTGQLIHILHYSAVEGENIIVFKNIPPGMYILRITTPDTKFSYRVIGV